LNTVRQDSNHSAVSTALIDAGTVGNLVRAAQQGNVKAFEQLYRLHSHRVFGLCLRMIRERDTAEDCVQQTFIKAWRNLSRFESRSAFSTWLHGIAVNVVLSHRRAAKPMQRLDDEQWLNDELDPIDSERANEEKRLDTGDLMDIEQALTSLPDGARYVIVLQAIYGYSHEEVASMLGIAVGTCKAQLHRARRMLRHRLQFSESDHG
jgi:RNA polymerase sigma-70 factor (ECF subfamily)